MIYTLFVIGILKIFQMRFSSFFLRQNLETLWAPVKGCSCFSRRSATGRNCTNSSRKIDAEKVSWRKLWYSKLWITFMPFFSSNFLFQRYLRMWRWVPAFYSFEHGVFPTWNGCARQLTHTSVNLKSTQTSTSSSPTVDGRNPAPVDR